MRIEHAGEIEGLRTAIEARDAAITDLTSAPASEELAERIAAEIEAGDHIGAALRALKLRLVLESARLSRVKSGMEAGSGVLPGPRVEFRG
ncbi:MAG: hypothetical protein ACRD30_04290 [Bryobacteraceae bacterium]